MGRGEDLETRIIQLLQSSPALLAIEITRKLGIDEKNRTTVRKALHRLRETGVVQEEDQAWHLAPLSRYSRRVLEAFADPEKSEDDICAELRSALRGSS